MSVFTAIQATVNAPASYSAEALAFFARLATQPSAGRKTLYSSLIGSLVDAGVWAKLDALYLFAATDQATALTNLKSANYTATVSPTPPSFIADAGITGDGVASYLNSNFNPTTATSPHYTQDDACAFAWSYTSDNNSGPIFGLLGPGFRTYLLPRVSNNAFARINVNGGVSIVHTDGRGLYTGSRVSSNSQAGYRNFTPGTPTSAASMGLLNTPLAFLTNGNVEWFNGVILAGGFGEALDGDEVAILYNALATYLNGVVSAFAWVPGPPTLVWVAEGDSITYGHASTVGGYPGVFNSANVASYHRKIQVINNAVVASAIEAPGALARLTDRTTALDALLSSRTAEQKYLLSVLVGANDAAAGVSTSDFITQLTNYLDARRAAGWDYLVVCTALNDGTSGSFAAWRAVANPAIRLLVPAHADFLCDFAANSTMGPDAATADTLLYADGLHPTNLGQSYLEAEIRPILFDAV